MKSIINFFRNLFGFTTEEIVKIETCNCEKCTCSNKESYIEEETPTQLEAPAQEIVIPELAVVEEPVEIGKEEPVEDSPKEEKKKSKKRYYKKKGQGKKKEESEAKKSSKKRKDA